MLKLFAVRDVKADAFGNLMAVPTKGLAVRAFVEACRNPKSPMAEYPEDYSLYELGVYDPNKGELAGHRLPELVMTAAEAIASVKREGVEEVVA